MVAELQVGVDKSDLAPQLTMQGDRGVDGDGRRPDPALGPVIGQDPAHRRARQQRITGREPGQQALDPGEQLRRVEWLDQIIVGAGPQTPDLLLHFPLCREHDDRHVRGATLLAADLGRHLVAVQLGQHDVQEDQVRRLCAPQPEAFGSVRGDDDVVPLLLEGVLQQSLDIRVVIDDEDLGRHQSSAGVAWSVGSPAGDSGRAIISCASASAGQSASRSASSRRAAAKAMHRKSSTRRS